MCHQQFWPPTHILTDRLDISRLIDKCKSASECYRQQIWLVRVRGGLFSKNNMDDRLDASVTDCLGVVWWSKCNGVQQKQQQVKLSAALERKLNALLWAMCNTWKCLHSILPSPQKQWVADKLIEDCVSVLSHTWWHSFDADRMGAGVEDTTDIS